jgi:hypothetical protein
MSGVGGKREGAGRKRGSTTVKKVDAKVINAGILPLEMRLRVARKLWADAVDADGEIVDLPKAKEAADFAESAMQYTSARLQATTLSGPGGAPIDVRLTDARSELQRKLAGLQSPVKG